MFVFVSIPARVGLLGPKPRNNQVAVMEGKVGVFIEQDAASAAGSRGD